MKRTFIAIFFGFFFIFCVRYYFFSLVMPQDFIVKSDDRLSSFSLSLMCDHMKLAFEKKKLVEDVVNDLKKQYAFINHVSLYYKPSHSVVSITSFKPLCLVNESNVLVDNGTVLEKLFFDSREVDYLPKVYVSGDVDHVDCIVQKLLRSFPVDIYQTHVVRIDNKNNIALLDKEDEQFSIVCSLERPITRNLVKACEMVKENIFTQGVGNKKVRWVADIRFADYVVAYKV